MINKQTLFFLYLELALLSVGITVHYITPYLIILILLFGLFVLTSRTNNLLFALVAISLSELLLGYGISSFENSINLGLVRLLLILIPFLFSFQYVKRSFRIPLLLSIGFGFLLPVVLIAISVIFQENQFDNAFQDSKFLLNFLMILPLSIVISYKSTRYTFINFILVMSFLNTFVWYLISLTPETAGMYIYQYLNSELLEESMGIDIFRYTPTNFQVSLIGFFVAFIRIINIENRRYFIVYAAYFLSILVLLLKNEFRGPLLGISIACVIYFINMKSKPSSYFVYASTKTFVALLLLTCIIMICFYTDMFGEFFTFENFENIVHHARIEQFDVLVSHILNKPIFGFGAGSIIPNYFRSVDQLNFELSYLNVFYKFGLLPVFLFFGFLYFICKYYKKRKLSIGIDDLVFVNSLKCTLGTILVASLFNPYLKTGYTVIVFAIYFALLYAPMNNAYSLRNLSAGNSS